MTRVACISSILRGPSGKRKESRITWLMASGGNRWPAWPERAGVVTAPAYPS
jgi:hypothetical protein